MSEEEPKRSRRQSEADKKAKPSPPRLVYQSSELLQGRREVWIEHAGEMYRLRVTSAGKLYLTK